MIIIRMFGGLGNQMFQYALYKSLQSLGKHIKIDLEHYDIHKEHNGFELETVFDINTNKCSKEEKLKLCKGPYCTTSLYGRFRNRIYRFLKNTPNPIYTEKVPITYEKEILDKKIDDKYLIGWWQTEKYFKNIRETLLCDFKFKQLDKHNAKTANLIDSCASVSIHVRRNDYIGSELHDICGQEYYFKAISFITTKIKEPIFFVFSDDIAWCKNIFKGNNFIFIDHNKKIYSYKDMQLMSLCKHNIIPNSTFSWWGAWLNSDDKKIVVAPKQWFSTYDHQSDIIPDSWEKI